MACGGDTARVVTSSKVKELRRQAQELKEMVAGRAGLWLLKECMIEDEATRDEISCSRKA